MTDELGPRIESLVTREFTADEWREAAIEYFARTPEPNNIFNGIARQWIEERIVPVLAPDLFRFTVEILEEWEAAHGEARHKGTPYYFLGMAYILVGDIDRGFLYMHLAFREDQRTSGMNAPPQPALAFVMLDATTDQQAFKQAVDAYAAFIEDRMGRYRARTGGTLTLSDLRSRVLGESDLWDDMFHLVYSTARILRLESWGHVARGTQFGANVLAQSLGDLCLVAEQWLEHGWPGSGVFRAHADRYLRATGVPTGPDALTGAHTASHVAGQWGTVVADLLDGTFRHNGRTIQALEVDIAITYLLRNYAAHQVTAEPVLSQRFNEIEDRVYSAIFRIVEKLP